MADLEPIGVQAVVEGMDTFTSEMGAMQGAIEQTGQSAEAGSEGLEQMGNIVGDILQARMIENLITQLEDLATNALTALISNAGEAEQVEARLDATLRALGDSAAVTKEQAIGLADSIMGLSTFEDEAVIAAETMLLRFTSIGQDIFPQALQASTDLAAGLGMDLTSAARMLGMALESPADGMSRLRRMGVMFTEQQQEQIKVMQAAGNAAGAQALMLDILNSKFGGTAAAMAGTYQGRMEQLKNTFGNLQETIGTMLLPTLTALAESLNTALSDPLMQKLAVAGGAIAAIGAAAIIAVPKIVSFVSAIKQIQVTLAAFSLASGGAGTALAGLTALLANPLLLAVLGVGLALAGLGIIIAHTRNVAAELDSATQALTATYNENIAAVNAARDANDQYIASLDAGAQEIVRIDVADRDHGRTLAETVTAELDLARAREERTLATMAEISASDGLDAATKTSMLSTQEAELASVRATIAEQEKTLAILEAVDAARAYGAETARLQGLADQYAASGAAAAEAERANGAAATAAAAGISAAAAMQEQLNSATYAAIDAHAILAGNLANEAREMWGVVDALNAYYLRTADAVVGVALIEQSVAGAATAIAQNGDAAAQTLLRLGGDLLTEAEKIRTMGPAFPKEDLDNFNGSVEETILLIQNSTTLTDAQKAALLNLATAARETANSNRQSAQEMAAAWEASLVVMSQGAQGLLDRMNELTAQEWIVEMGFEVEGLPEGLLPTSPKSRWQARLEMLDKWTNTHTIGINMEVGEEGGTIGDPLDWLRGQMDLAGKLGGIGDFFGNLYQEQQVDPLVERAESLTARIEELNAALVSGKIDAGMYNKIMYDLTLTEEERARVLAELAEKQERLQRLQEAQQQLDFLQQQMDLLDLITEYGLNPEDILAGVELGANADIEGILDALTRAMEAIIAQGAGAFPGMEEELPPGGEMMAAPALPAGRAFGMQVTVGPNYINNGMDEALFAARVEQVVIDALAAA